MNQKLRRFIAEEVKSSIAIDKNNKPLGTYTKLDNGKYSITKLDGTKKEVEKEEDIDKEFFSEGSEASYKSSLKIKNKKQFDKLKSWVDQEIQELEDKFHQSRFVPELARKIKNLKLLRKYNLIPIPKSGSGKYEAIGSGAYAVTYEVLYKGKRVVAKISNFVEEYNSDVVINEKLNDIKKELPGKYKKHIMTVYDSIYDDEYDKYILVCEWLDPLPRSFKLSYWLTNYDSDQEDKLYQQNYGSKDKLKYYFENEKLDEIVKKFISSYTNIDKKLRKLFLRHSIDIVNVIKHLVGENTNKLRYFEANKFHSELAKFVALIIENSDEIILTNEEITSLRLIASEIFSSLNDLISGESFPQYIEHPGNKIFSKNIVATKEMQDFYQFLIYLKENYDIDFFDLHDENVRVRPGTNDLVVSDPGLFEQN